MGRGLLSLSYALTAEEDRESFGNSCLRLWHELNSQSVQDPQSHPESVMEKTMGFHQEWADISSWVNQSTALFIKKLSRNDTSWADSPKNGHQNGFYIPRAIAESDFFPKLENSNPDKPHIFDIEYGTFWPSTGETKTSKIKHFSQRNPNDIERSRPRYEWHHTGVPKNQFQGLTPASLLVTGRLKNPVATASHWFVVVDSASEVAEIIETAFELASDFHYGLFDPARLTSPVSDTEKLIAELTKAIKDGTLESFIKQQALPSPQVLAAKAQASWIEENKADSLNPFNFAKPGDAVMRISRDIEYAIYKQSEIRFRAAQVARILLSGGGEPLTNLVRSFPELDSIFLSAAQTRKSRAGLSFEHHVERLFKDGRISYQAQSIFGGRRPDFVLPGIKDLNSDADALIVSLKTTLRERWKQLALEKPLGEVFLATVDDRVSSESIGEMERNSISLVVPESLKSSKESVYTGFENVITFKDFFEREVKLKRPSLILSI